MQCAVNGIPCATEINITGSDGNIIDTDGIQRYIECMETRVYSRLRELRTAKEAAEGRKLPYALLETETGVSESALVRLFGFDPIDRIDGKTITKLCQYFGVGVGDLLEYRPEPEA